MKITDTQFKKLYLEQQSSNLTVNDFCSTHNISVSTFYRKKKIIENKQPATSFIALNLLEQPLVKGVSEAQSLSTVETKLPSDSWLEFTFPNGTKLQVKGSINTDLLKIIAHLY